MLNNFPHKIHFCWKLCPFISYQWNGLEVCFFLKTVCLTIFYLIILLSTCIGDGLDLRQQDHLLFSLITVAFLLISLSPKDLLIFFCQCVSKLQEKLSTCSTKTFALLIKICHTIYQKQLWGVGASNNKLLLRYPPPKIPALANDFKYLFSWCRRTSKLFSGQYCFCTHR